MIRRLLAAAAFATVALSPAAFAQDGAAAPAKFNTTTSTIGQILDNAEAKAVFAKILPEVAASPQLDQGRDFTIEAVAQMVPDAFPADKVKELETELAKIK